MLQVEGKSSEVKCAWCFCQTGHVAGAEAEGEDERIRIYENRKVMRV